MAEITIIPVRPVDPDADCQQNCVTILMSGQVISPNLDIAPAGYVFVYAFGKKVYAGLLPVFAPISYSNG